jgi:hypothetical protein
VGGGIIENESAKAAGSCPRVADGKTRGERRGGGLRRWRGGQEIRGGGGSLSYYVLYHCILIEFTSAFYVCLYVLFTKGISYIMLLFIIFLYSALRW